MGDVLSAEQIGQIGLLRAMVDPDAKAQVAEMIDGILSAQKAAETALVELRKQEATNRELLSEANLKVSHAATMAANAEAKRRELEAFEGRLGEVNAALNAEKTKFEDVRLLVNNDHKARGQAIGEREARLDKREREIGDLMMKNTAEAKRLAELGEKLDRSVAAMKAALAELDADPPVDAG